MIALARIDKLELLPAAYGEILAPDAVYREVTGDPLLPGAEEVASRLGAWLGSGVDQEAMDRAVDGT